MNNRKDDRTNINVEVNGLLVVDSNFRLLNISDSGALIRIPQKLDIGNFYYLKFDFIIDGLNVPMKLKTKVVREKLIGYGTDSAHNKIPVYEVGLSFYDTSKEDVRKLKIFIAQKELGNVTR